MLSELEAIGADISSIEEPTRLINDIHNLLQLQTRHAENLIKLDKLNELVKNSEAAGLSLARVTEIQEEISSVKGTIQNISRKTDVQIELKLGTNVLP